MKTRKDENLSREEYINIIYPRQKQIARQELERISNIKKKIPNTDFLSIVQANGDGDEYGSILIDEKLFTKIRPIRKKHIMKKRKQK